MTTSSQDQSSSFIVKIWVEESATRRSGASWRGHITNVASGERKYVRSLDEITTHFRDALIYIGVDGNSVRR